MSEPAFNFNPNLSGSQNRDKDPNQGVSMSQYGQMAAALDERHQILADSRYLVKGMVQQEGATDMLHKVVDCVITGGIAFAITYVGIKVARGLWGF